MNPIRHPAVPYLFIFYLFFDAVLLMSRGRGEHPENSNKPPPQVAEQEEDEIDVCVCVFWRLIPNKSVQIPILTFLVCEEVRSADDSGSFGKGGSGRLRTRGGVAVQRGLSPII